MSLRNHLLLFVPHPYIYSQSQEFVCALNLRVFTLGDVCQFLKHTGCGVSYISTRVLPTLEEEGGGAGWSG